MTATAEPHTFLPLSNLMFHVLVALADQDRHGYAIIRDIEERTADGLSVRSGALYTVIQRLLDSGLISNASVPVEETGGDARRKYYRITRLGREVAALEGARLAAMVDSARSRDLLTERKTTA